jgi:hypothetical protein
MARFADNADGLTATTGERAEGANDGDGFFRRRLLGTGCGEDDDQEKEAVIRAHEA